MTKPKVFISYARDDQPQMAELLKHLRTSNVFEVWTDTRMNGGDEWKAEIEKAMEETDLAVFLFTKDFMLSDFIRRVEIPRLVARHAEGKTILFPVLAKPCGYKWHELSKFQFRPGSGICVWEGDQFASERRMLQITEEMTRLLSHKPTPPPSGGQLQPLRTFTFNHTGDTATDAPPLYAVDARGRLWVSDGSVVQVFRPGQDHVDKRTAVESRRWKARLSVPWGDRVVYADWDGSVLAFDVFRPADNPITLHEARPDDTPTHRLELAPDGELVAANWGGVVRRWDAKGVRTGAEIRVPYLVTHLRPLGGGEVALTDPAGTLRVYDPAGKEVWAWASPGPILDVWPADGNAFLLQIGREAVVRVSRGQAKPSGRVDFPDPEPVVKVSRRDGTAGEVCVAVARENGRIDWLSLNPLVRAKGSPKVGFPIKDVLAVRNPAKEQELAAVGIDGEGQLFTLREGEVKQWRFADPVQSVLPYPGGSLLYLVCGSAGQTVHVVQNPVVEAAPFRASVVSVGGPPVRPLVKVKNDGPTPFRVTAAGLTVVPGGETCQAARVPVAPTDPGGVAELEFPLASRPTERGSQYALSVSLADETRTVSQVVELWVSLADLG